MRKSFILGDSRSVVVITNGDSSFNRLIGKNAGGVAVTSNYNNLSAEYKALVDETIACSRR